jgi:hypothetical protein
VEGHGLVVINRTVDGWQALVPGHGSVTGRSLQALDKRVRTIVGARPVDYRFRTGNEGLDRLVRRLRITRAAARSYENRGRQLVEQVVRLRTGLSQRDISVLIGLSHQRVQQLATRRRADS